MERPDSEAHDALSDLQQKYIVKKPKQSSDNNKQYPQKDKGLYKKRMSRTSRPFLIFFCLLVSPAIYDQFAPLKTIRERVKAVNYGVETFRNKNTVSSGYVLNISTYENEYKLFGSYYTEYNQLLKSDTLTITKTQILAIPRKFESRYASFENHAEDFYVFYSSILVVLLFFLSFLFRGDVATMIIFGISIASTVICVGMYL